MRALLLFVAACSGVGGSAGSDIGTCQETCDNAKQFDCISAAEQTLCRSRCSTAGPRARQSFVACQEVTLPQCDPDCFAHLGIAIGGGEGSCSPFDVMSCQAACDTIQFFDCFDAAELSRCRAHCTDSSMTACTDFSACVNGSDCSVLLDCYARF
jgi:hypothetical protein